jgi:NAD(P)-dependent dehydrogenase (short-subunit alcohol dehydrogenase family)
MKLSEASAVITGGASGLGAATARAFVAAGANVTIFDLDPQVGKVAKEIGAQFAQVDVTSAESISAGLDVVEDLNVVVNCAGIATVEKTLGRDGPHRQAAFERTVGINLNGTFNVARLAAARMKSGGVIINTASVAAFEGQKGQAAYAASKAGIAGLSLPMARDLARSGIRVMAIAPGIFRTPMLESLGEEVMTELAKDVIYPNRLGDPAEFAALAAFIVECEYLNGTTIRLDGALRMP